MKKECMITIDPYESQNATEKPSVEGGDDLTSENH